MIKVSVVGKDDIGKCLIKYFVLICVLILVVRVFSYYKVHLVNKDISLERGVSYLAEEIAAIDNNKNNNFFEYNSNDLIARELRMSMVVSSRNMDSLGTENGEEENVERNSTDNGEENKLDDVKENVQTELVESKYKDTYNCEIEGVKIKNETDYNLDSIGISSNVETSNKNVIIYHTHTCESYTETEQNQYESSGNFRTTDLNYSVAKVGDVLDQYLTGFGFNVIHDKTYHDYPSYTGSYGRSMTTVSKLLESCDKTNILIDIHRDAIADESYAPKVKIGDEYAARIMFVIGTDGSGLEHPNWKENLAFAIKVQKVGNEMYPGLFKSIMVRNARYNQNLGRNACIIEVGATGNTLEECEISAKYLAKVLDNVVQ